jgi:hypothetical protein
MAKAKIAKRPAKAAKKPAPQAVKKAAPVAAKKASVKAPAAKAAVDGDGLAWIPAERGYSLTLDVTGKLLAKNPAGKRLSSVPKEIKDGDVADRLDALSDWLDEHARACAETVEQWMLRSLPVPRAVLERVWEDPAWRKPLENAVVVAGERTGLFRGVDAKKGVGFVDLDGETGWIDADRVAIPHPILVAELDDWRDLVTQLGVAQGIAQLHRETYTKPTAAAGATIEQFADGKFAMLLHALGKARALGFKVRGGFATCKVYETTGASEARYWIGSDDPQTETYTGSLAWVDERERALAIANVGPVAFSEGMRMASSIYAARVVEKEQAS